MEFCFWPNRPDTDVSVVKVTRSTCTVTQRQFFNITSIQIKIWASLISRIQIIITSSSHIGNNLLTSINSYISSNNLKFMTRSRRPDADLPRRSQDEGGRCRCWRQKNISSICISKVRDCFAVLAMTGLPYKLKAPEILAVPLTSNVASGEVVPIQHCFHMLVK